jgi:Holliday junction resolvase RusA-like endonuclease
MRNQIPSKAAQSEVLLQNLLLPSGEAQEVPEVQDHLHPQTELQNLLHLVVLSKQTQMNINFYVEGIPKGQPRPKAFSRGGHAAVYDPGTAESWKSLVAVAAKPFQPQIPFNGPLTLCLDFTFPRPKCHYRSGKNSHLLKEGCPNFHTSKPDSDNLAKAVMDAMTQLSFWMDDSQVWSLYVSKLYTPNGGRSGCSISLKIS